LHRRVGRRLLGGAGVAVAVAALIALVFALPGLSPDGDDDMATDSAETGALEDAATATSAPQGPPEIANARDLRAFVATLPSEEQLDRAGARGESTTASTTAPASAPPPAGGSGDDGAEGGPDYAAPTDEEAQKERRRAAAWSLYDSGAAPSCSAEVQTGLQLASAPFATARVTHRGDPAEVVVFRTDGRTLATLYDPDDCRVLISQTSR
jgi:hypothetical protein